MTTRLATLTLLFSLLFSGLVAAEDILEKSRQLGAEGKFDAAIKLLTEEFEKSGAIEVRHHRAHMYLQLSRFEEAIADYTWVIEQDPTMAGAHLNRALAYLELGMNDEVIADRESAIAIFADQIKQVEESYYQRALVHPDLATAIQEMKKEDSREDVFWLFIKQVATMQEKSTYATLCRKRADTEYGISLFREAAASYVRCIRADLSVMESIDLYFAGKAFLASKRPDRAVFCLTESIKLDGKTIYPETYTELRNAYRSTGDSQNALTTALIVWRLNPSPDNAQQLAVCNAARSDAFSTTKHQFTRSDLLRAATACLEERSAAFDQVIKNLVTAVEMMIIEEPENAAPYMILSNLLLALDKPDDALKARERALDIDPTDPIVLLKLADSYAANDRYDDAMHMFDEAFVSKRSVVDRLDSLEIQAASIAPQKKEDKLYIQRYVYSRRGNCYFHLSKFEEAIAEYEAYLKLPPEADEGPLMNVRRISVLFSLSYNLLHHREDKESHERALTLATENYEGGGRYNPGYVHHLAACQAKLGMKAEALQTLAQAKTLNARDVPTFLQNDKEETQAKIEALETALQP